MLVSRHATVCISQIVARCRSSLDTGGQTLGRSVSHGVPVLDAPRLIDNQQIGPPGHEQIQIGLPVIPSMRREFRPDLDLSDGAELRVRHVAVLLALMADEADGVMHEGLVLQRTLPVSQRGSALFALAVRLSSRAVTRSPSGAGEVLTRAIRQAIGLRSTPTDGMPRRCASSSVVPQPQNGSKTSVRGGSGSAPSKARGMSPMNLAGYG